MISKLELYILNSDNSVAPFIPIKEHIVLYDFSFESKRMGPAPEITATIQAEGGLENYLTSNVFCEYNGERYFLKSAPSVSKDNADPRYTFELTFVSERVILDNVYMVDAVQGDSAPNDVQTCSTNVVFMDTIEVYVARLNAAMQLKNVGYSVVLDEGVTSESKLVSFQDKYFTEALQEGVKIYNIPYYFVGKVVHFGAATTITPTLKYGDGLLGISKSLRSDRIVNRATATGSSENIPYYYPNPTPMGEIEVVVRGGTEVQVDSYLKLSKIPRGGALVFHLAKDKVDLFSSYAVEDVQDGQTSGFKADFFTWNTTANLKTYPLTTWAFAGFRLDSLGQEPTDASIKCEAIINTSSTQDFSVDKLWVFKEVNGSLVRDESLAVSQVVNNKEFVQGADEVPSYVKLNIECIVKSVPVSTRYYFGIQFISNKVVGLLPIEFNFSTSQTGKEQGWYLRQPSGIESDAPVSLADYGLRVTNNVQMGEISYDVIKEKVPFASTLMPPIYRESGGIERFYNAQNGLYEGIFFENEYNGSNPKEAITSFDTKPTIVGVTNAAGDRIDTFIDFAYDRNDSDDTILTDGGSEEYINPYFYAKLRKFDGDSGFNLFAQAIESGEMMIEITSGHCGACKFTIMVDENTQRNLVMVDSNGDLVYDDATGKVKMASDAIGLDRQNDTVNNEVWIALKKDINTFGQIMPNATSQLKPSVNDTFVITNILLPQAYYTSAEKKLEEAILSFLVKNNSFAFDPRINFSRIALKQRQDIRETLSENAIIPIEFNGKLQSFYVSSYTYRKQKNELLPEISVSLTDSLESEPTAFETTINAIQVNAEKAVSTVESSTKTYVNKKNQEVVTHVEESLSEFVSVAGSETITGEKNFVGGLFVNGNQIAYNAEYGYWELVGDLIVSGAITMFGSSKGFEPSTITDAVSIDNYTIKRNANGQLYVAVGGTGGGGTGSGLTLDDVVIYLNGNYYTIKQTDDAISNALTDYAKKSDIPSLSGYATETWVKNQKYATQSALSGVDSRLSAVETFFATDDTDNLVNKWSEIVTFLNATEGDTLDNILSTKADKSALESAISTLNTEIGKKWTQDNGKISNWDTAFGWGDHSKAGYAGKSYVDTELTKYVKLATAQSISAQHDFTNGIKVGGLPITKAADGTLYLDANVVVSGAITMFGSGSTTFPTIWANIPFNKKQMTWNGSEWSIIDGGSGSGVDANAVNVLINEYLDKYNYATQSWVQSQGYLTHHQSLSHLLSKTDAANTYQPIINSTNKLAYSLISGTPDLSVYFLSSNFTKANIKSTLGISDWALAATKPSYTAAEVGALATSGGTINGSTTLATGNLIVLSGDTVVGKLYPTSDASVDLGQSVRRWVDIYIGGYLSWGNSADMTDIGDWNTLKGNYGLRIISSITTDSGAPYTYATALHVKGRYGFELAVQGGDVDSFSIRSVTHNREWKELIHSGNIGSYNAGSATKLATPRTIWGQSFDGTGNIATTLHITSKDVGSYNEGIRINNIGGYSSIWFNTINKEGYDAGMWGITANNGGNLRIRGGDTALVDFVNITRAGNVVIGGTTADELLHVHGTSKSSLFKSVNGYTLDSSTANYCGLIPQRIISSGGDATDFWLHNTTKIHYYASEHEIINNVTINGNLLTTGAITMFSQASLKNISDKRGLSLDELAKLEPTRFYWKDGRDDKLHIGGIADEVIKVLPEAIYHTSDGTMTMDYGSAAFFIGTSLIKPVIDHERRIGESEKRIADLERESERKDKIIVALENKIKQLTA